MDRERTQLLESILDREHAEEGSRPSLPTTSWGGALAVFWRVAADHVKVTLIGETRGASLIAVDEELTR